MSQSKFSKNFSKFCNQSTNNLSSSAVPWFKRRIASSINRLTCSSLSIWSLLRSSLSSGTISESREKSCLVLDAPDTSVTSEFMVVQYAVTGWVRNLFFQYLNERGCYIFLCSMTCFLFARESNADLNPHETAWSRSHEENSTESGKNRDI